MRQPREHSKGESVLVSESRSKPPRKAVVTDYRPSPWNDWQYKVSGSSLWHTAGNVNRVED